MKNLLHILYFTVLLLCFTSCEKEENGLATPQILQVEAEGGIYPIKVKIASDWEITGVINKKGDAPIAGEAYAEDGKLIRENYPIALKGKGRIESIWQDKGFIITRSTTDSLVIEVLENCTGDPFSFGIMVQDGKSSDEIVIQQKVSQGYQFGSIEYKIKEGDRDSLFTRQTMGYTYTSPIPQTVSFSPYGGVDIVRNSSFVSNDLSAFIWIKKDSVEVSVPESIVDGRIYLTNKKDVYGTITRTSYMKENPHMESLEIPEGEGMKFHVELEYRQRIVSYTLTLVNNRTKAEKKVEGKWIEITPTGNYIIIKNW